MKIVGLLLAMLLASTVAAQNMFTGRIESYQRQGESLIIDGVDYRVTGDTVIVLGGKLASRSFLQEGQSIRYTLDHKKSGERRFINRIELPTDDQRLQQLLQH